MALWNSNNSYQQTAYSFAVYFIQTYNENPHNLFPVLMNESMMSHNGVDIVGGADILNYLSLSNIKNLDIPQDGLDSQPSGYGLILITLYGTYNQLGLFSASGGGRNIILTMTIMPDTYGNYFLLNLIIKTKDRGQSFTSFKF